MESLLESPLRNYLPTQLIEHLRSGQVKDQELKYSHPAYLKENHSLKKKASLTTRPSDVRLPARISSPLIPYPTILKNDIIRGAWANRDVFHSHHTSQLETLASTFINLNTRGTLPGGEIVFDMDSLKRFAREHYSHREDLIAHATLAFAHRATCHDLSIAAATPLPFNAAVGRKSEYLPMVIMIQRLRVHIAKTGKTIAHTGEIPSLNSDEAVYMMFDNGTYLYGMNNPLRSFYLLACGGHFRFFHSGLGYWFAGPLSYLDYVFSIADILNNLDILSSCREYQWAGEMFQLMIRFAEIEGHHKDQVDFMKGLEGLFLNISDYDEAYAMNWKPLLVTSSDLWELDKKISEVTYPFATILCLLGNRQVAFPRQSQLCRFITAANKLSRTQCQEVSALHKLIFYAEVNAQAGVEKFLKRVHTPRTVDPIAVKNLTRLAKQIFFLSYVRRHKTAPNCIGPPQKLSTLKLYVGKSFFSQIEGFPLSWWDDVKIFNCMDNTLTSDPLEFAKDKGALKEKISFGPGDSRKELLQIIERTKYDLKDFFSGRTFVPKEPRVLLTTQSEEALKTPCPARLIEKEREQKYEARLFANAELSEKHSLSLVAARMKKALAYFDEQLMTPTDRKRKELIHDAARDVAVPTNYSLLLDIEGHNQSMQAINTSELSEFVGNLFGYEGWGDLPNYFSQLEVYHYDEYEDKVIRSQGQLGGIEGWLNPLWTLHTTLMMKLLRIMTDMDVKKIMVYSDDVNAVIGIPQASEAMVQSLFLKVMNHCNKFGMIVKYSQTMMSKHRITMLRQHYADGIRADSTLKRLISMSAGNNSVLVSDELEISGISSAAASALELSNHSEACSYLKNYKMGMLTSRLLQMILSHPEDNSMISLEELPKKLSTILYYTKEDAGGLEFATEAEFTNAAVNDASAYLQRRKGQMNSKLLGSILKRVYDQGVAAQRMVDNADRVLYLQIYDVFLQDLLFFWIYLPTSVGGLGGSLHLNLILSGHSIGMTKALHYLMQWICKFSSDKQYFLRYLSTVLSVDMTVTRNCDEKRLASSNWPSDSIITSATSSTQQAIRSMVKAKTVNKDVRKMFDLEADKDSIAGDMIDIFRDNFHSRIVQFYHENTSGHFVDLLLAKVETSSGLLLKVRNLTRLRNSLAFRSIENVRRSAKLHRTFFLMLKDGDDIVELMLRRKMSMFPRITFVDVEEILYDDKVMEVDRQQALITVRRCAPTHYKDGIRVYDDPKVGNETLYKGELLDDARMLGHKEELLAAKLVAVTKWFLTKTGSLSLEVMKIKSLDVVQACNLSLSTLTNRSFSDLANFAPTETGGEILHRIPNLRFSTSTYIRAEMNKSLNYTTDINQRLMTALELVDSNVNVDYLRMRLLVISILRDKYDTHRRLVTHYGFCNYTGVKDVQFVTPKSTSWNPGKKYKSYAETTGHELSEWKFRYLATSYMFEENTNEWALMPSAEQVAAAEEVGMTYVNDIILRYSRDLDKDYMLITPGHITEHCWVPLMSKLDSIDPRWCEGDKSEKLLNIKERLATVMQQRRYWTPVDKSNTVSLSLQRQCLECLFDQRPDDSDFFTLADTYMRMAKVKRSSQSLNIRLAKYQAALSHFLEHREMLQIHLLAEYAVTFHFKLKSEFGILRLDTQESVREMADTGFLPASAALAAPALQFQMMLLGLDAGERVLRTRQLEISNLLDSISEDISLADIETPTKLPSMGSHTVLSGNEEIPDYLYTIDYLTTEIPESAMKNLGDLSPLARFAHRCSITGARPETFTSFTGSDSLGAQLGLFRNLLAEKMISPTTTICDLTAGRGDGAYAMQAMGLSADHYSRMDTFSRLQHHPSVIFKDDYDVFDGSTLKFITGYEHVHIDISFTEGTESSIIDVVCMLEEHNIQYSIRLNSVHLEGYQESHISGRQEYQHFLSYAGNSNLKPYQIYLIGRPARRGKRLPQLSLRETVAYRAMTTSFARLLSPRNYDQRLESFEPNSASIYLPSGRQLDVFIKEVGQDSLYTEQLYYLKRYLGEVGEGAVLAIHRGSLDTNGRTLVDARGRMFLPTTIRPYDILTVDQIGNVSDKSRPYHERHLRNLVEMDQIILSCPMLECDEQILKYFRTKHPLKEVRSWCNIILGLRTYCLREVLSGHDALKAFADQAGSSLTQGLSWHQRDLFFAIKLLLVAAVKDSYAYGTNYCKALAMRSRQNSKRFDRILRIYRLLSYLFVYMQYMLSHGHMSVRTVDAIRQGLEEREVKRYKYVRQTEAPNIGSVDEELVDRILGGQQDKIFESLSNYAQSLVEVTGVDPGSTDLGEILGASGLVFDIGIETHINNALAKLGLKPEGDRGIIDLGDSDIMEADDW